MHLQLILAGLMGLAMAAPVEVDVSAVYGKYTPYAKYDPYTVYQRAVEKEAANMRRERRSVKRDGSIALASYGTYQYNKYNSYTPYSGYGQYGSVPEADAAKTKNDNTRTKRHEQTSEASKHHQDEYASYAPYTGYSPYSSAVEAEAAKTDMAKRGAEREKMSVNELKTRVKRRVMLPHAMTDGKMIRRYANRRDASETARSPDGGVAEAWYGKYNPYNQYGQYSNYGNGYPKPEAMEAEARAE